jgi:nucleoid DNA-binding protein
MNEKLNIQDLIDTLAERHGMSKKNADSFVKEFFQLIEESLEKDKYVKIRGLGTFKLIDVGSRENNPKSTLISQGVVAYYLRVMIQLRLP